MAWTKVAERADIERGSPLAVEVAGEEIALYWLDGEPFATSNICSHAFARLSEGFLDGGCIECPIHQAQFDIRTGAAVAGPADTPIRTYPCRVTGESVEIDI
ncbi:non-heme iron oxygenase ferredoxin subunit [Xanthobacteraceae bacterium Astr-EGSB]|uniref:Rieske (2Fe-2S) protein n=1 Tax=Astrobacterium formosum TaxID=3069710 RepID=UPI0027B6D7EF|nr:non-heme iron oxygenase ferredoxin subunit [Xanthobacteraceae bacterium Astr-EGSB]